MTINNTKPYTVHLRDTRTTPGICLPSKGPHKTYHGSTCGCAILVELDYLCRLNGLQVPSATTGTDAEPFPCEGHLVVASSVHLLSLWFAPTQMKWIHNHFFFLTGRTDVPFVLYCNSLLAFPWGFFVHCRRWRKTPPSSPSSRVRCFS